MTKKRIFIAIKASEKLISQIDEWKKQNPLLISWIQSTNLHLTIIPPFYSEQVAQVEKKLGEALKNFKAFEIIFEQIIFGPKLIHPNLIWALGPTPFNLIKIKQELEVSLEINASKRDFLAHITLARFKKDDLKLISKMQFQEKIFWVDYVKSVLLMESILQPSGVEYKILKEIVLS